MKTCCFSTLLVAAALLGCGCESTAPARHVSALAAPMSGEDTADAGVFSSPEVRMAGVSGGWEQSRKDSKLGGRDPDTLFAADSWEGPPTLDVWQVRTYTISRTPETVTFLRRTQGTVDSGYRRYVR